MWINQVVSKLIPFLLNVLLPIIDVVTDLIFTYNLYQDKDYNYFKISGTFTFISNFKFLIKKYLSLGPIYLFVLQIFKT